MINVGDYSYDRRNLIGRGGFGSVYEGTENDGGRAVAIKVVFRYRINEQTRREIENLMDLNCRNIVCLFDYYTFSGNVYLVMELCIEDVETRIENLGRQITEPEIRNFLRQTARGLDYIHDMGIIHRDIKPKNILISRTNRNKIIYKIADFGISKMIEGTERMTLVGTPDFIAPEIHQRGMANYNADIWSLGVTVCYMITRNPRNLRYRDYTSNELGDLLSHMLQRNPTYRYSAEDVLDHDFIVITD